MRICSTNGYDDGRIADQRGCYVADTIAKKNADTHCDGRIRNVIDQHRPRPRAMRPRRGSTPAAGPAAITSWALMNWTQSGYVPIDQARRSGVVLEAALAPAPLIAGYEGRESGRLRECREDLG